jgi:PAS domain S-box-containing protein
MKTGVDVENNFMVIFDAFPSGMLLIDSQFTLVHWNRAVQRLFSVEGDVPGSTRIGKLINCPNHCSDPRGCGYSKGCRSCGLMRAIRQAINDGTPSQGRESVVSVLKGSQPQDIWFLYGVVPLSLGGQTFALLSFEDITERKQVERALRESEERYRLQFHQSQAVMLIVNPQNGEIEDANPAACDFYGYDRAALHRMKIYDINTMSAEYVHARMQDVVRGEVRKFECQHIRADESLRDVEVFTSPIVIGSCTLLHSIIVDITFRLAAENELRGKMDFAENLVLNSTTPTFVINSDHQVLIWNRALEELTGVRGKEIIGTDEHWRAFYPSVRPCLADIVLDGAFEKAPELYTHFSRSRLIPDGLHAEGDFSFDNRRCRLVFSSAPVRDRDGRIIAAIETLEDITERISLESQLFHAQKLELVGLMAGGIAHDFNNVLTVISGYADLLQLTLSKDEQNLSIAREILSSVERAADITRSLLAFSGKHEIQRQYDDLNLILNSIRKSLSRLIREDITLTIRPEVERLPVYVDRVQIEQVLINLVLNARDAIGTGGIITVSAVLAEHGDMLFKGDAAIPPGRYACLRVADNGPGMDVTTLEHIFEPFFTTKEKGKGTGLGLAIVNTIVAKHNGYISVTSTPARGTEFAVYLPLYAGEMSQRQTEPMQSINHHGTETVLMVEDDAAIMRLNRDVLGRYGYSILCAVDGVEAMELFNAHRDEIQIAVVDVIMPRMNGREVVEQIRLQCPKLPIIMCSGYTDEIIDRAVISQLKVVFLQKPVKPFELLATLRSCLHPHESGSRGGHV